MSIPGTPSLSRSATRPGSPSPGTVLRPGASRSFDSRTHGDPLKAFPTHLSQRIFGFLDISDLANCARVCKKWCSSQSINYGKHSALSLGFLLPTVGQCGFGDIARRISTTKVSRLGSGPGGSRSKTGYGQFDLAMHALTLLSAENLIHTVNSGSRVGRFWVFDLKHPFWLPITEGDQGGTMAR